MSANNPEGKMLVELKKLKPNPRRDFNVDPIEKDKVKQLVQSIRDDGFWGGVVCRRLNGEIQIAAGHHRVLAAIECGLHHADLTVLTDVDDDRMIRIYAVENATQRGNAAAAQAGVIASTIRKLATDLLMGNVGGIPPTSKQGQILVGQLQSEKGLGWDAILNYCEKQKILEPEKKGNTEMVKEALANLKASGNYARIISEVRAEIEEEHKAELEALARAEKEKQEAEERRKKAEAERKEAEERARKAQEERERRQAEEERKRAEREEKKAEEDKQKAQEKESKYADAKQARDRAQKADESASQKEITFDLAGVSKWLTNQHHIEVFRSIVTSESMLAILPVNKQAQLAKQIAQKAASADPPIELTGRFIRENITDSVVTVKRSVRQLSETEEKELRRKDWTRQFKALEEEFMQHLRSMHRVGLQLSSLLKDRPQGATFPVISDFRSTLQAVIKLADNLLKRT